MKLSAEQAKTFLRIQRKHNVSGAFILRNMPAILKFIQYAITPHIVLKCKLIRKRDRVFLQYNYLRKLIFDPSQLKKRQRAKRVLSQWSERLVAYLKRYKMVEFFEDENTSEAKLPEVEVSKQLKEQLELLKSGKRRVPLFDESNNVEQRENLRSSKLFPTDETCENTHGEVALIAEQTDSEGQLSRPDTPLLTVINVVDNITKSPNVETVHDEVKATKRSSSGSDRPNGNFLDMLISKVKSSTDDVIEAGGERSMEPPKTPVKTAAKEIAVESDERENSNSSSDFFGFDDSERILGTFPGMLSTPLVEKRDSNPAFVSEILNAFMRDNSLESSAVVDLPQRRPEDGLVLANSTPPKLDMPALPEGLQALRTVAERRTYLQKTKNVKNCIINNVGTIFRELQKRTKGHRINRHTIETLQTSSVPFTRQGWKAATWLLTDVGNYYFQTITVDGEDFRLFGSRGNSQKKFKIPHTSRCEKISSVCTNDCIDRIIFRSLRPIRTLERRSKLRDAAKTIYKACPLSQKILQHSQDDNPVYGSLEIMRMPQVELEVFPQLQRPLSDIAKRYLQLILPYNGISREWAQFSVSTLLERQKMCLGSNEHQSFTFTLPYANDRDHVLVRRLYNRSEVFDNSSLSFRKEIDQKRANGDPPDLLAMECADVLTDMLNCVAISFSENSFIKDDPDNIYGYGNSEDDMITEKSVKKTVESHQHQAGHHYKKQSRMVMELRRLNATIIDAAASKTEEDGSSCDKESCRLGCVCASLNEGTTVRHHCGKQRCIIDCSCKCPSIMRLETDGRTITTEDAFMLRRQATAKLARMEKEFTSTIVLTGSETLLINESQYDKKRRCTKIPKRYGDFVDPNDSDVNDSKLIKRADTPSSLNFPLVPIMVKDKIYQKLKHCAVRVKRLRDVKDLAPWCMIHMVYKCHCKGQAIVGNPIVLEKQKQEENNTVAIVEDVSATKGRTLYSFEKEESKANDEAYSRSEVESNESDYSDSMSNLSVGKQRARAQQKLEKREREADNELIEVYMNAQANHCRRVVPIPRSAYLKKNKKHLALIQLYIAEHETDETRLNLTEHMLRSVYHNKKHQKTYKIEETNKLEERKQHDTERRKKRKQSVSNTTTTEKRKLCEEDKTSEDVILANKRLRMHNADVEEGASLLRVNRYKDKKTHNISASLASDCSQSPPPICTPLPKEQITVPKISQIFSLNSQSVEMGTDTAAAVAAEIPQQSTEAAASTGVASEAIKNVLQVVVKNMNNLVSKKMQDIDMALRRESKAIPAPNDEILCIIRWNHFLEAFMEGLVYLWEVRTVSMTFIAATIRNIMPLVVNALSVVNIRALPKDGLPLLGRMLIDRTRNSITNGLAVVMQGQKMYWLVKGFLRPDKRRICPKPTPETHPELTEKINRLCRLLISQQMNEHKKRQNATLQLLSQAKPSQSLRSPINHSHVLQQQQSESSAARIVRNNSNLPPKIKVLPMQRNISDHATAILEQMVTQAYGTVRTNITIRKLHQCEIGEIYQPVYISTDHHWHVLDLSNDFSHIFIPELKDLLTLDRIQKVMAYAVTKSRVVKMQFSQKSLFNAYVTPNSHRKLYFGPFRNTSQTPKLILLQSVDGQMMLREVYESRHNVATKTDKTTAFWLIQNRGKLFLDVLTEIPLRTPHEGAIEIQDEIQEIEDDDDISIMPNALPEIQPTRNVNEEIVEPQYISVIGQEEESLKKTHQLNEDDDDCMIVEDDVRNACASHINIPDRLNYTISYAGENSSLVVVQNECEIFSEKNQDNACNSFTILTSEAEESVINTPEIEKSQFSQQQIDQALELLNSTVNAKDHEPMQAIASPILKTGMDTIQPTALPTDLMASVPINTSQPIPISLPVKVFSSAKLSEVSLPPTSQTPPGAGLTGIEPVASPNVNVNRDVNTIVETAEPDSNLSKPPVPPMKWNKNVTITKVLVDSEQMQSTTSVPTSNSQPALPTPARKSLTVTSTVTGKVFIQGQQGQKGRLSVPSSTQPQMQTVAVKQKPRMQMQKGFRHAVQNQIQTIHKQPIKAVITMPFPKQMRQFNTSSIQAPTQRVVVQKINHLATNQRNPSITQRPMASSQGGLTVRTPTAINTFIKHQQQQLIRHPASIAPLNNSMLSSSNPSARMLGPATLSPTLRMPISTATASLPAQATYCKNPPKSALPANATKSPNSLQPQQFKRVVVNQKLSSENPMHIRVRKLLNGEHVVGAVTQSSSTCDSLQSDPLHISEESSETFVSKLPEPKLPNDVKTVRNTPNATETKVSVVSPVPVTLVGPRGNGVKRNSMGAVVNRSLAQIQSAKQTSSVTTASRNNSVTVVTTVGNSSMPQKSPIKGIPIELPRLKKFAIISSANTTVITPPTSKTVETIIHKEKESSPVQNKKIFVNGMIKCASASTSNSSASPISKHDHVIKVSANSSVDTPATPKPDPPSTIKPGTEYGYFQANVDGLPKFVVKRVNDDFLIKVPNFNGILKLTGISTVHNYLNQYSTQKCGKTAEEVSNLKWIFRSQDRSKLNNINKSNAALIKPANVNSNVQKVLTKGGTLPPRPLPSGTLPAKTTDDGKPKESIVLVDDE